VGVHGRYERSSMSGDLGDVLVAMATADARCPRLTITVLSRYDGRYLTELVEPATGQAMAELTTPARGLSRWLRPHGVTASPTLDRVVRARLRVEKPDRWRYEDLDEDGTVRAAHGCDGERRWARVGGPVHVWRPQPVTDPRHLPEVAWQQCPHPPLREIVDPALVLPAFALEGAESLETPHGAALRLHGAPRSADVVESALASPWADRCVLDVHRQSGVILAARSSRDPDWTLISHDVTELDLDTRFDDAVFAP
jgi:hypothetical protein